MSDDDILLVDLIEEHVRKVMTDLEHRAREGLIALENHDYAIVIGALAGLDAQIQHVAERLTILYEVQLKRSQRKRRT